jgi:hypothetical protein
MLAIANIKNVQIHPLQIKFVISLKFTKLTQSEYDKALYGK